VALVAGVVLLAVALVPGPAVHPFVERAVVRHQSECVQLRGFEVRDAGSWPTVVRAAAGRLVDVSVHVDEVLFNRDFPIHDVSFSADRVEVAPLRFGMDRGDAVVRGGESSATVRFADVERVIADQGVDLTLRWEGARLVADVQVPLLGVVPTTVDLQPVDGDLELRFAALDLIPLPSLLLEMPEPVAFRSSGAVSDGIRVDTAIDGTVASDDWGCDAATEAR
jgi:hypothetical protein